ncbi:MAG: N-acyl-D-amino-acid deacylase [Chloroflexota bacterium]|nr:N-acyl-D-amino-acid deacylase [Chloroflexota bacterium]
MTTTPFDVLLLGGNVVDGTGNPWFPADVGIRAGRIAAIGRLAGAQAGVVLRADGHVVSPGFIDMHSHSDFGVIAHPPAESAVAQGVTTQLIGSCGISAFPRRPATPRLRLDPPEIGDWSAKEYFGLLGKGIGTNVAVLVGHNRVRACVMGLDPREPTAEEQGRMRALVEEAMGEGAVGLSTCLEWPSADSATTAEVVDLARAAAKHGGFYSAHLRTYSDGLFDALAETVQVHRETGMPVHLPIVHTRGRWRSRMGGLLAAVADYRTQGVPLTMDVIAFPAFGGWWGHRAVFPDTLYGWQADNLEDVLGRLADPGSRAEVRRAVEERRTVPHTTFAEQLLTFDSWDSIRIEAVGPGSTNAQFVGQTVTQAAERVGANPTDFYLDLLMAERRSLATIHYPIRHDDWIQAFRHPQTSFGLDVVTTRPDLPDRKFNAFHVHPAHFGGMPDVLGTYTRDLGILSLEEAIRKMTSLAATQIGLRDRGILTEGAWADIAVFNPRTVAGRGTWFEPRRYPVGIQHVLVNGVPVVRDGKTTAATPGRVVTRH